MTGFLNFTSKGLGSWHLADSSLLHWHRHIVYTATPNKLCISSFTHVFCLWLCMCVRICVHLCVRVYMSTYECKCMSHSQIYLQTHPSDSKYMNVNQMLFTVSITQQRLSKVTQGLEESHENPCVRGHSKITSVSASNKAQTRPPRALQYGVSRRWTVYDRTRDRAMPHGCTRNLDTAIDECRK